MCEIPCNIGEALKQKKRSVVRYIDTSQSYFLGRVHRFRSEWRIVKMFRDAKP